MHETVYVFAPSDWDAQMVAWTIANSRKLANYVTALKIQHHTNPHLTQRQLWLDSGLELIKD